MSLHTRYRPWPLHAGPSDQRAPVHRRWIGAFGWRRPLNSGSIVSTSGSVKYTFGGAFGPKSRGGVVIVLGGAIGAGVWAAARRGPSATAPAATPAVLISTRLDIRFVSSRARASLAMD